MCVAQKGTSERQASKYTVKVLSVSHDCLAHRSELYVFESIKPIICYLWVSSLSSVWLQRNRRIFFLFYFSKTHFTSPKKESQIAIFKKHRFDFSSDFNSLERGAAKFESVFSIRNNQQIKFTITLEEANGIRWCQKKKWNSVYSFNCSTRFFVLSCIYLHFAQIDTLGTYYKIQTH